MVQQVLRIFILINDDRNGNCFHSDRGRCSHVVWACEGVCPDLTMCFTFPTFLLHFLLASVLFSSKLACKARLLLPNVTKINKPYHCENWHISLAHGEVGYPCNLSVPDALVCTETHEFSLVTIVRLVMAVPYSFSFLLVPQGLRGLGYFYCWQSRSK